MVSSYGSPVARRAGAILFLLLTPLAAGAAGARPRVGLALSGGGAKGAAHVGVLRVLEEMRVPVDCIAGTSMGAIVAGLYASGMEAGEIEAALLSVDWDDAMRDRPGRENLTFRRKAEDRRYLLDFEAGLRRGSFHLPGGLRTGQKLLFLLQSHTLPVARIEDFDRLPTPLRVVATDIETGEMVVLGKGDLARALRASMAIPGVFSPVELEGRVLVDGGVVNNLPIDLARRMGADVVLAVDLGTPLAEREVSSLVDITNQTLGTLTRRNVEAQLDRADLVITPEVDEFGVLQFDRVDEIVGRGMAAARAHRAELARYAVAEEVYRRHREARRRPETAPPVVDFVRLEGHQRVDERILRAHLETKPGAPLDLEVLRRDLERLYGLGDFELIEFYLAREEGEPGAPGGERRGVVIRLREKPWGPHYLHFGLSFATDLDGATSFGVLANLTSTRLNARGAEWRTDLLLGRDRLLLSELYQPLDFAGRWFVAPRLEHERKRPGIFRDGREVAELEARRSTLGVDLGRQFGKYGELRLGLERGFADAGVDSGALPPEIVARIEEVDVGGARLSAAFDRLDSATLPRRGGFARFHAFRSLESLGAEAEYTRLELRAGRFAGRGPHTLLATLDAGWTSEGELPLAEEFAVGGFLSLSGLADGELRGQYFGVGRLGYYRHLGGRLYAGGWLEAGNAWRDRDAVGEDLLLTATALIAFDSPLGPVYAAYGYADSGDGRLYLLLGRGF